MPARQDAYSVTIPVAAPPPQNLSSYARFMHDHTRRQMQAFEGASAGASHHAAATTMNGTSSSNASPTEYHP